MDYENLAIIAGNRENGGVPETNRVRSVAGYEKTQPGSLFVYWLRSIVIAVGRLIRVMDIDNEASTDD